MTAIYPLFHTASAIGAAVFSGKAILLSDFANVAEYTGLFDQYKIEEAEAWIYSDGVQQTYTGQVTTCVDLDDISSSTVAQVEGHQGSLSGPSTAGRYHKWRPRIAQGVYGSGVFTNFANVNPLWIDSASTSVNHYGVKMASVGLAVAVSWELVIRAKFRFRNPGI